MKLITPFRSGLLLASLLLAGPAFAQKEQWLRYGQDESPRAYRWLDLGTDAPPGVALPKLEANATFARWITPMDPSGGRWIAVDRTRRSGPPNRLFIDQNGDGRLDDEKALALDRRQMGDDRMAAFEPARLVFAGEDGPVVYHLILRVYQFDEDRTQLLAGSGGSYAGQIDLGGSRQSIRLIDANVNGAFDDVSLNPSEADHLILGGDRGLRRNLGRYLEVDGKYHALEVARDGAFVKLTPAPEVVLGRVRLPGTITDLEVIGDSGHFNREAVRGECTVPVGRYRLQSWTINRKDEQGAAWRLTGTGFGEFGNFTVTADDPVPLEVGEPVIAALSMTENRTGASFGLRFKGQLGETVTIWRGNDRPRAPRLQLASVDGPFRATHNFEYG